jgi:hypothetical protein
MIRMTGILQVPKPSTLNKLGENSVPPMKVYEINELEPHPS